MQLPLPRAASHPPTCSTDRVCLCVCVHVCCCVMQGRSNAATQQEVKEEVAPQGGLAQALSGLRNMLLGNVSMTCASDCMCLVPNIMFHEWCCGVQH